MKFNPHKLGAGLLAVSPLLINIAGSQFAWWLGVICAVVAPFIMAVEQ